MSHLAVRQHSAPYSRMGSTNGWVSALRLEELDFHMLWSLWKELRVFPQSVPDAFLGTTVLANLTSQVQKVVDDVSPYQ